MTEDEITHAASRAVMNSEPGSVVLSVRRLPGRRFGWVVVFEGGGGERRSVTFEHRAEEPRSSLREKIEAALARRREPNGESP